MFDLDLIGVRLSLQRQLWTHAQLRAASRRSRALRRRRLGAIVLGPPHRFRRQVRHG